MSLIASITHAVSGMTGASEAALGIASGAATVGAGGLKAFSYNRENYMFDQGFRWTRYTSGYGMAIAQAKMYREDIRDLTALTCTKQDTYHVVGVIFFVINIQLIMAGRLGVHGPSPPGWLLGIYWGNSASAIMFLVLYTWLAMHASARATSGAVHLLTRSVRLPIPTAKQLDKARVTGNAFEKQRTHEVFRVPFVAPAPRGPDSGEKGASRKMSRWYQVDELEETGAKGIEGATMGAAPDHFELYRELQTEWVGHDVYARIGMLYYMSHWIAAIPLYSVCHVFGELRALWPAWTVSFIFAVGHYNILKLDIVPQETRTTSVSSSLASLPMENIVPIIPILMCLGMTLDYSIIVPSTGWKAIIYVLSWICYIIQFLWSLRTFDIARPADALAATEDQPGLPQYPAEWRLPPALAGACYIVAPPEKLEGFPCLQQEMKLAKGKSVAPARLRSRKAKTPPTFFAWKLLRGGVLVTISIWVFLIIARIIEQINGERMIMKQEGRIERWPCHMQPWMPPWTRKGSTNEWAHTGGADRRLQELQEVPSPRELQVQAAAQKLANVLGPMAEALEAELLPEHSAQPVDLHETEITWPAGLDLPDLVASGGSSGAPILALLASRGAGSSSRFGGSLVRLGEGASAVEAPEPFELQGLDRASGDIMSVSWSQGGSLLLTTSSGALAECDHLPLTGGAWPCRMLEITLPTGGSSLLAASVAWTPGKKGSLRAAVRFSDDEAVTLLDSNMGSGVWLPAGEIKVPEAESTRFTLSATADELLLPTHRGDVLSWALGGSQPKLAAKPKASGNGPDMVSRTACSCGGGRIAQLAAPRGEGASPKLLVSRIPTP